MLMTSWGTPPHAWLRPCVETEADVEHVLVSQGSDSLPMQAIGHGAAGVRGAKRWELPSTILEASAECLATSHGVVEDEVELRWLQNRTDRPMATPIQGLLRVRDLETAEDSGLDGPTSLPEWARASQDIEDMLRQHFHVVGECRGRPAPPDTLHGASGGGHAARRSLSDVMDEWDRAGHTDEPRYALIVHFAQTLGPLLSDVCHRPRMILNRTRLLLPVGRVQQIDPACLRWLARQSGLNVVEKAGARQEVLGVARVEQADTLENRVVKDLLHRSIRAAVSYLREHREFGVKPRITVVRQFLHLLRRLLLETPVGGASKIIGIPNPNYVLQHDSRYSRLWDAYLRLILQERELDRMWQWRQRTWVEVATLALAAAVRGMPSDDPGFRADVHIHGEQVAGQFIDPCTMLPPHFTRQGHLDILLGARQLGLYPSLDPAIVEAGPDAVIMHRVRGPTAQRARAVAMWAFLPYPANNGVADAVHGLRQRLSRCNVRPLLILPRYSVGGARIPSDPNVLEIDLARPQGDVKALRHRLAVLLDLEGPPAEEDAP